MRALLALLLLPTPAAAWEFRATPVCTLAHEEASGAAVVTYDPRLDQPYAISLTRPEPWPTDPVFAIRFGGADALTITTNRHVLSGDERTLTVIDRGFGNVLDGLEFGPGFVAFIGEAALTLSLDGAAEEVRKFRDCAAGRIV